MKVLDPRSGELGSGGDEPGEGGQGQRWRGRTGQRRDRDPGDVAPEFLRGELHDFPGLLCRLGWSTGARG